MPGTITRDAAKGLIVITGGTVAAPVTCADIIAAAVAGGWTTVTSSGDTIVIQDHLSIGGATPAVFADKLKTIQVGLPAAKRGFAVKTGSQLILGEKKNGVGIGGGALVLYADNTGSGAVSAFSGVSSPGLIFGLSAYGLAIYSYITNTAASGAHEFGINGTFDICDVQFISTGTPMIASGAVGAAVRLIPSIGTTKVYLYSTGASVTGLSLDNTPGVLCGGGDPTLSGVDFGAKLLERYYGAKVTLNDCAIVDANIINTGANADAWVKKLFTHSTQALYNGMPLAGVKVRMSINSGAQDYAGTTNAAGLVSGGLLLAKQHNWAATTNAYTLTDNSAKKLRVRMYGKKFVETVLTLDAKATALVPLQDESVTLAAQATVAAWASAADLKQIYEISRHYGEADLSLPDPVTLAGGVLDFGAYNVILSTAAAAVWAVSGNTVTVKCAASVASAADASSIKTTGTVTLTGVTAGFGIVDATGDSFLSFTGIDSWIVYSDPGRTVQIGAGTGSQLFRFVYAAAVTRYLKCVSGSTEFAMVATATAPGATVVSLSTQALLTTLQAAVGAVKLDTVLIKSAI